jgi:hypothetical protein
MAAVLPERSTAEAVRLRARRTKTAAGIMVLPMLHTGPSKTTPFGAWTTLGCLISLGALVVRCSLRGADRRTDRGRGRCRRIGRFCERVQRRQLGQLIEQLGRSTARGRNAGMRGPDKRRGQRALHPLQRSELALRRTDLRPVPGRHSEGRLLFLRRRVARRGDRTGRVLRAVPGWQWRRGLDMRAEGFVDGRAMPVKHGDGGTSGWDVGCSSCRCAACSLPVSSPWCSPRAPAAPLNPAPERDTPRRIATNHPDAAPGRDRDAPGADPSPRRREREPSARPPAPHSRPDERWTAPRER